MSFNRKNSSNLILKQNRSCLNRSAKLFLLKKCHNTTSKFCKTTRSCSGNEEIPSLCLLDKKGSITLEASLILPLFIMAMSAFLFYFQFIELQQRISQGLYSAGWNVACVYNLETVLPDAFDAPEGESDIKDTLLSYAGELAEGGITGAYVRKQVLDYTGTAYIDNSCIKNGAAGLTCFGIREGTDIRLLAVYKVTIPFFPSRLFTFDVSQQVIRRLWIGLECESSLNKEKDETEDKPEEDEGEKVYITKYGRVYHLYIDCQSIKRDIKTKPFSVISELTNSAGKHYTSCIYCVHGNANALVFVTAEGERYHNSLSCGSLKRYILTVDSEAAAGYLLCSFCEKRKEKADGE